MTQALQRRVKEKLGECLLRLQAYEGLMKAVVANHEISVTGHPSDLEARVADVRRKTLGVLVNQLVGAFLIPDEPRSLSDGPGKPPESEPMFNFRVQISLSAEDHSRIESDLKDFVTLRNDLVHHFFERHDLTTIAACRLAEDTLIIATRQIERHFYDLRTWAEDLLKARLSVAELIHSPVLQDFVATGRVPWSVASIVHALREAAMELSVDGWAPVSMTGDLISLRYPEQRPLNYGCRSWRQVLHESGLFDLHYRRTDGHRTAWYREKRPAV